MPGIREGGPVTVCVPSVTTHSLGCIRSVRQLSGYCSLLSSGRSVRFPGLLYSEAGFGFLGRGCVFLHGDICTGHCPLLLGNWVLRGADPAHKGNARDLEGWGDACPLSALA